jgi:hypothetical protein
MSGLKQLADNEQQQQEECDGFLNERGKPYSPYSIKAMLDSPQGSSSTLARSIRSGTTPFSPTGWRCSDLSYSP